MTQAKDGDAVQIHYTGKLDDDSIFDSSEGREPLSFTIGGGEVIPGFDDAVKGMKIGEKKTSKIPAEKAYGAHKEELVMEVGKDQFPDEITPEIGQKIELSQANGEQVIVVVTSMDETNVTLDSNPPLAGKDLTFEIELIAIA